MSEKDPKNRSSTIERWWGGRFCGGMRGDAPSSASPSLPTPGLSLYRVVGQRWRSATQKTWLIALALVRFTIILKSIDASMKLLPAAAGSVSYDHQYFNVYNAIDYCTTYAVCLEFRQLLFNAKFVIPKLHRIFDWLDLSIMHLAQACFRYGKCSQSELNENKFVERSRLLARRLVIGVAYVVAWTGRWIGLALAEFIERSVSSLIVVADAVERQWWRSALVGLSPFRTTGSAAAAHSDDEQASELMMMTTTTSAITPITTEQFDRLQNNFNDSLVYTDL